MIEVINVVTIGRIVFIDEMNSRFILSKSNMEHIVFFAVFAKIPFTFLWKMWHYKRAHLFLNSYTSFVVFTFILGKPLIVKYSSISSAARLMSCCLNERASTFHLPSSNTKYGLLKGIKILNRLSYLFAKEIDYYTLMYRKKYCFENKNRKNQSILFLATYFSRKGAVFFCYKMRITMTWRFVFRKSRLQLIRL